MRTSRNMAYYPPEFVERIQLIKRLQEERFMPLRLIKEVLGGQPERVNALLELEDSILEQRPRRRGASQGVGNRGAASATTMPRERARPPGGDRRPHADSRGGTTPTT